MTVWYATREQVKASVDVKNSLRANASIDRAIADASRSADRLCRRIFYPRLDTRRWYPSGAVFSGSRQVDDDSPTPGVLWLGGESEIIELVSFTDGGQPVDLADVFLFPETGPPYTRIEHSPVAALNTTATAWFGYGDDQEPAGLVATVGGISSLDVQMAVTDGSVVGVGALLSCGDERMIVTEKRATATGLTLAADVVGQMNAITLTLSGTTAAPEPGEMILIGGERMLVQDRIGTAVYVTRQVDGTVLAAHLTGAAVHAYRTLTVTRGQVGTTAAIHLQGAELTAYVPHPSLNSYVVAEALNQVAQENSAYARVIGSGDNQREARGAGLKDKRDRVRRELGRRVRMGAI
jgi:hypothetical protein